MIPTAQTLAAVFKLTDDYTATMQKIIQASDAYEKRQQQAQKATEQFKASMKGINSSSVAATSGLSTLALKFGGIVTAAALAKKTVGLLYDAIQEGAKQQVQLNTFQSLSADKQTGSALYNYVSAYAKNSALGKTDLASATTSWLVLRKT